jgi:restriction system protein
MTEVHFTKDDVPKYHEFMYPVLHAIDHAGGSATSREIRETVIEMLRPPDDLVSLSYEENDKSIYIDRLDWGRSYCKLGGLLDSPKRSLFLLTADGRRIVALPQAEAESELEAIRRKVIAESSRKRPVSKSTSARVLDDSQPASIDEAVQSDSVIEVETDEPDDTWQTELLARLHQLSPDAFEEFCLYMLKLYGLELSRVGGSGDEGIDGIGTAPLSPVLSARVAVQCKRYDPSTAVSRDAVALFQRDAQAKGAERAIFVTVARFTAPARRAAVQATPTVDLIDGERLCELVAEQGIGVTMQPVVDPSWFDRFER